MDMTLAPLQTQKHLKNSIKNVGVFFPISIERIFFAQFRLNCREISWKFLVFRRFLDNAVRFWSENWGNWKYLETWELGINFPEFGIWGAPDLKCEHRTRTRKSKSLTGTRGKSFTGRYVPVRSHTVYTSTGTVQVQSDRGGSFSAMLLHCCTHDA